MTHWGNRERCGVDRVSTLPISTDALQPMLEEELRWPLQSSALTRMLCNAIQKINIRARLGAGVCNKPPRSDKSPTLSVSRRVGSVQARRARPRFVIALMDTASRPVSRLRIVIAISHRKALWVERDQMGTSRQSSEGAHGPVRALEIREDGP